jgi:hypothetical protein
VLWLLADRLGMAEGAWAPFRPPIALRPLFPSSGDRHRRSARLPG